MALVKCYRCGGSISDKAMNCPKCGAPANESAEQSNDGFIERKNQLKKRAKFVIVIPAILVLLVLLFIFRTRMISLITIEDNELYLGIGEKKNVEYAIYPTFAATKKLDWNSDNPNVALVNNGVITGIGEGTATISVESPNGKSDSCIVKVASIIDEWEWYFTYIDGKKITSDTYSAEFWINGNACGFTDMAGDTYTGTWKFEEIRDGIEVYSFDADGSLDFNITISGDSLTVSPELSNEVVVFFDRK